MELKPTFHYVSETYLTMLHYAYSNTDLPEYTDGTLYEPTNSSNCTNGDARLVNGDTTLKGRVEICYNGEWLSVCNIPLSAASVICKQLGYSQYASKKQPWNWCIFLKLILAILPSNYGSSPTYITSLSCSFDYNHLNECTINTQSSFCGIASPASCSSSIQCYRKPLSSITFVLIFYSTKLFWVLSWGISSTYWWWHSTGGAAWTMPWWSLGNNLCILLAHIWFICCLQTNGIWFRHW